MGRRDATGCRRRPMNESVNETRRECSVRPTALSLMASHSATSTTPSFPWRLSNSTSGSQSAVACHRFELARAPLSQSSMAPPLRRRSMTEHRRTTSSSSSSSSTSRVVGHPVGFGSPDWEIGKRVDFFSFFLSFFFLSLVTRRGAFFFSWHFAWDRRTKGNTPPPLCVRRSTA